MKNDRFVKLNLKPFPNYPATILGSSSSELPCFSLKILLTYP